MGLVVLALLMAVRASASDDDKKKQVAPVKQHYMLVGTQRTGTTWVMAELDKNRCILARDELMLERPSFRWTEPRRRDAFRYLYDKPPNGKQPKTPEKWKSFYNAIDKAYANSTSTGVLSVGFKWMLEIRHHLYWLVPEWKKHGVRIIVLRRRNHLKTLISRTVNNRRSSLPHPTPEQALAMARSKVVLATGHHLRQQLVQIERSYSDLKTFYEKMLHEGLEARMIYYEDLKRDPTARFLDLENFLLGLDKNSKLCAGEGESFKSVGKIHTRFLQEELANWEAVASTLRHSKYDEFIKAEEKAYAAYLAANPAAAAQKKKNKKKQ